MKARRKVLLGALALAAATVTAPPAAGAVSPAGTAAGPPEAAQAAARAQAPKAASTALEQLVSGLEHAWALDWLPDGTALFTERNSGRIRQLEDGRVTDVQRINGISVSKEGGLLGLAVSPNYAQDRTIFIYYTTARDNRIAKLRLGERPRPIVTGIPRGSCCHHGGRLEFGPDGYLYAGTGDGLRSQTAQDLNSLGGKVLRMTTDGRPAPGNPFNSLVYSYGHRNVQGLAWSNGALHVTDIGANKADELNRVQAGRNYGWPACEGPCNNPRYVDPVQSWRTSVATPSGLAAYQGKLYMAALKGGVWRMTGDGGSPQRIYTQLSRVRAVEPAPDGSLLVITPTAIYSSDGN
ncbi:hypothetical protein GCM10012275_01540 [Longimycelium tulufanense]|uniref:Glucose/Sorbosone dehydrogenase domain-containing protein n=1 Tax=Longimycelium tulufanense TaxID=907463 RepID=A0A8J3C5X3_9PSEU|nr:PQQ-dependent sugar dehydrogenase [Longimycelium tulufanense]GGM33836.1 hypothetical protein GCM10012275_01540 [Longimycelium tulufanense]